MKVNKHVHEYLRSTLTFKYTECENCKYRTQFGCTICGYCWSCHYQKEQSERQWLKKLFTIRDLSPISYHSRYDELEDTDRLGNENHYEKITVVDVCKCQNRVATTLDAITNFRYMEMNLIFVSVGIRKIEL